MIQLKINGQWKNADMLGLWVNREGKGNYHEVEIQDFKAFGADYSYKELMKLSHADMAYKVEQVYSESGSIGDLSNKLTRLSDKVSKLDEFLRHILIALGITVNSENTIVSTDLMNLQNRVSELEEKTAMFEKLYTVIKEINSNEN